MSCHPDPERSEGKGSAFSAIGSNLLSVIRIALQLDLAGIEAGLRVAHLELANGTDQNFRDSRIAIPLMVGRDDEPWSVLTTRVFNRVLICLDVLRPVTALGKVGFTDLPLLVRISETFRK